MQLMNIKVRQIGRKQNSKGVVKEIYELQFQVHTFAPVLYFHVYECDYRLCLDW
jgi:hypothetical protein